MCQADDREAGIEDEDEEEEFDNDVEIENDEDIPQLSEQRGATCVLSLFS